MIQLQNKSILHNGIRVLTESVNSVRSSAIGVFIHAGTRDESLAFNGIAHFTEHMSFKGTLSRSAFEIADIIESRGGQLNAYTSKELTAYYVHILAEDTPLAVELLADIVLNSTYPKKDISIERTVIEEEIQETDDTPQDYIFDLYTELMFPKHPLGFRILGTEKSVRKIRRKHIIDFVEKYYSPDRIVVAAAGKVEHSVFTEFVDKYFSKIPYAESNREIIPVPLPQFTEKTVTDDIGQSHIVLGRQSYSYHTEHRYAYQMINAVLSAGMSSRLFQNIREKEGGAYTIYSFMDMFNESGLFGVYVATDPGKRYEMIDKIWKEFNTLKHYPMSEVELSRIRMQYKGSLILNLESMNTRLERLCRYELQFGKFISIDEIIEATSRISAKEIQTVANELFNENEFHTLSLIPEKT